MSVHKGIVFIFLSVVSYIEYTLSSNAYDYDEMCPWEITGYIVASHWF